MRTLVLGGIRSGKSQWSEQLLAQCGPVRYVATGAVAVDDEFAARVSAHRDRRPAHWSTVETADVATELRATPTATLIDDIGGWVSHPGGPKIIEAIVSSLDLPDDALEIVAVGRGEDGRDAA